MAFQLVIVIIIPILMGIFFVPPFDPPEGPIEEIKQPTEPISDIPDRDFLYFFLMLVWLFFLIRILFQIKRGTFTIQRKF
ncbi:MAG: hypothetical protein H2B03_08880 [Nitrosopumilaceae archaeon]|uniref:Uncharacterized protein n=1 Tax=Candidatus Nitrosomaritimum aestuariumsis TaxID=3342354 RepID=A0AC60W0R8_9ARCH|nr:hypothetical protein [Nitrosopumilaceae archaeon]